MKIANTFLGGIVFITILVQVLLVYGHREAYLKQLNPKEIAKHTVFRNLRNEGTIKAIKAKGIKFKLYLGADKQGFRHDYRRVGLSYSKQGDTLEISATSGRYDAIDFCDFYFPQVTQISLVNSYVTLVTQKKVDLKAIIKQNSVLAVESGKLGMFNTAVADSSSVRLSEHIQIDQLEIKLADKAIFQKNNAKVEKVKTNRL